MNWQKIKNAVLHYVYGLLASCWNAGIRSVKLSGGLTVVSDVSPSTLPTPPNIHLMAAIFITAVAWEALDFFAANPLPVALPNGALDKTAIAAETAAH
jgi:hypothetical protein